MNDDTATTYHARSAQDAERMGYGADYCRYLEQHAQELHAYFSARGEAIEAVRMLTRTLAEALMGNEGR